MEQLSLFNLPTPVPVVNSYFSRLLNVLGVNASDPGWPDQFGQNLNSLVSQKLKKPIHVLSLFSGGGGLDIAFHDAGFTIIEMVEIKRQYVDTLELNAKEGGRFHGSEPKCIDIANYYPPENIPIDFIIGGPPCQTFSAAGRRAAGVMGTDDPRGNLFKEYVRLLQTIKPKGFLFENVYGIVGAQQGKPWKEIVAAFEEVGYKITFRILDTADYGVPQHRERMIIVGLREGTFAFPSPTHGPDACDKRPFYNAGLAVEGVKDPKQGEVGGKYGYLLRDIPPGLNYSFYTEELGHPNPVFAWRSKFSDFLYKADPEEPVRTIKAQGGQYTGPFHWENRPFSIGELKRLQTFPDTYQLSGGRLVAIEQIGNSVPPQFGRMLALSVLAHVFGVDVGTPLEFMKPTDDLKFRGRKSDLTQVYRTKAREAIARLYPKESEYKTKPGNGLYTPNDKNGNGKITAYLGPHFEWFVKGEAKRFHDWNLHISIVNSPDFLEAITSTVGEGSPNVVLEFIVAPVTQWPIAHSAVKLSITDFSPLLFTGAWKAFEYLISKEGVKADLVQLNGYYQYKPNLKVKAYMLGDRRNAAPQHFWDALIQVSEGNGVRAILRQEDLMELWGLSRTEIIDTLILLKDAGYEIRSEFTNPQIPKGHILIPYCFPTLNPKSVQLRKMLFP